MTTSSEESWLEDRNQRNIFTTLLINARSLLPKLESFRKILKELCADICLVTETWFRETEKINDEIADFTNKTGYCFLRRDRKDRRGGGIAICYKKEKIAMSKAKIPPSKHEIYAAIGRRRGQRRKIAVLVAYVPPWYNAQQNKSFYKAANDALMTICNKYVDPYVIVGGDFNRRSLREATREYPDITQIATGPTRADSTLDIIATNFLSLIHI